MQSSRIVQTCQIVTKLNRGLAGQAQTQRNGVRPIDPTCGCMRSHTLRRREARVLFEDQQRDKRGKRTWKLKRRKATVCTYFLQQVWLDNLVLRAS